MTIEYRDTPPHSESASRSEPASAIPPGDPYGPAPLSASQERMWLFSQLLPVGGGVGLPTAIRLRGALNVAALQQSMDDVVRRHEVLRSVVALRDGRPVQLPGPHHRVPFRFVDLRALASDAVEKTLRLRLGVEADRAFDLRRGPLLRVTVFALGRDDHVVALSMHHIVTDDWSMRLLSAELSRLFRAFLGGLPCPLTGTPAVQYRDFARWQQSQEWSDAYEERARELADLPNSDLPVGRRVSAAKHRSATWTCVLPPRQTVALRLLRRRVGGSMFMLVLAGLMTLIHRLDGRDEVVVGTLAAGRVLLDLEEIIGVFVNVLAVRCRFDGATTFRELCGQVKDDCVAAYAHQDLPYEKLLDRMRNGSGRTSGVRVLCVAQQPPPSFELAGLAAEAIAVKHPTAQFDLVVEIRERADTVRLAFKYDTDVLDEPTVRLLGGYLRTLLAAVAAGPDIRCDELALAAPKRPRPTPSAPADTVHRLFEEQVARTPDSVAVKHRDAALTYRALNARSNRLARQLRSLGVGSEDRVGVCLDCSLNSTVALLAVLKAGAAYVPLDPGYPAERLRYMLADSGASCVVSESRFVERLGDAARSVLLDRDGARLERHSATNLSVSVRPNQLAYVIYTSGTTGRPKGVLGLHCGAVNRFRWMWRTYPFADGARACQRTPPSFVDSVWEVFGPLLRGVPAEVLDDDVVGDPHALVEALATAGVTRVVVVPSLLRVILDSAPDLGQRLPRLRLWSVSGERLNGELAARFLAAVPDGLLLNLYGSAEVSADATAGEVAAAGVSIGQPIDSMSVTVVDAAGRAVPDLIAGELVIAGTGLARGYHGRPAETAARFVPDVAAGPAGARAFRSGDLGRAHPDGVLEFLGRVDDQVKIRGFRVEPAEVEDVLMRHPAVAEAAVVAHRDAAGTAALTGYVVLARTCPMAELTAYANKELPAHLVPSVLVPVAGLPLTPNGKVDRRRLPVPETVDADDPPGRLPNSPAEHTVAAVYAELLPVRWRSVHDDFFQLGGHSILAAAAVLRLSERCGSRLELRDLFDQPTIAGLAGVVASRSREPAQPTPKVEPRPGEWYEPFPLTDVQQAYWIGRDPGFEMGNVATHAYFEVDADQLDMVRFTTAIQRLVSRHHALRTVVGDDGTQRARRDVPPYRPALVDLRAADPEIAQARLADTRAEMSHQVLPADRWPLFDIRVSLLPDERSRIHVSIDALIADAYSVQVMMAELGQLYLDPAAELEPLELTFRDCVIAEVEARKSDAYQRALAYWRSRVAALPGGPELPLVADPGLVSRPRFRRVREVLPASVWDVLAKRAAERGLTKSGFLLSAFSEVITAWSGRPHYTLTLTLFHRMAGHSQVNRVIGDFTSLVLLEVDHREGGTFVERSRRTQARLWSDLDNCAVSGVTVMREWTKQRGGKPGLIAPVVFTSTLDLGSDQPASTELGTRGYGITQTPQLYLDHQVAETPEGLALNTDVVADLFPDGLVDTMFAAYIRLLLRLAEDEDAWDEPVRDLLPPEQRERRSSVNATATDLPRSCLHELVAASAARWPDASAVVSTGRTLTYRDVSLCAARVARRLRDLGVGRGQLVGIAMHKGWEQVVAAIGVSASGAAYVPLDPDLPAERMAFLAGRTGIDHVLTQSWLDGRLPGLARVSQHPVDLDEHWPREVVSLTELVADGVDDRDLAYVIFTSGSTGTPKGVMIDHRGAVNTVLDINRRFGIGSTDRVLTLSSQSFDLSGYDVFGTLAAGGAVVVPRHDRRRDPAHWLELVGRENVTVWNSVPALMNLAVEHTEALATDRLLPLRLVMLSGDWIPVRLPDRIRALAGEAAVISLGGATEASIWSVHYPVGQVADGWTSIPYGRPLANQRLHVLDRALEPRPDWVSGDLYIAGDGLALGYWRDPERTAQSFVTHPRSGERLYRTGDLARYRDDGDLEFLGREDLQVKIAGYRVELGEVETALDAVPGVACCAVAAIGPREEKRLVAFYVPEPGEQLGSAALRDRLRHKLPGYLVPSTFTAVEQIPLTANGKIDRAALIARATPAPAVPVSRPDLRDLEQSLAELWAEVLEVPHVQPDDNFFQLGGTSLVAVRLVSRLQAALWIEIPLTRLFESPTVRELAAAIGHATTEAQPDAISLAPAPADRLEPFPLTDIQQAYWMGRRGTLELGNVATHSYSELDVADLDVARLETAVQRLVDRHDALRTVILPNGRQRVLGEVPPYRVTYRDLRGLPPDRAEARLAAVRGRMSHQVHVTDQWPLFEIVAHRLNDRWTRLHVSVDLLVADARSFRILQQELLAVYHDAEVELLPLGCTFRDYVLAVEEMRDGGERQLAKAYWRSRVNDLPPAPALPTTRELTDLRRPVFERLAARLDEASWTNLQRLAAQANVTPSGVLCAAFADVLALWSQQRRFLINLTTFNRQPLHPDVDFLVGDFTSTTLLAVDAGASTFTERAGNLQQQIFADLQHRAFSGTDALRLLRRVPGRHGDAIAPIVFTSTLVPEPVTADVPPPWEVRPVYGVSQTPQVLVDHQVSEHAGELLYTWDFVVDVFPPGMIGDMFQAYGRLLHSLHSAGRYWKANTAW